jgi:hypothetical protein
VSSDDDDDALTWAGARDPSLYETPEVKPSKATKASKTPKAPASGTSVAASTTAALAGGESADTDDEMAPAMSSVVLIALGLLGGIYLLYTVGWFISWQRLVYTDPDLLELAAFRAQQVLAIIAAPLWFAATLFFTRERKPAVRLLWLVVGAVVLVPWSFTFGR